MYIIISTHTLEKDRTCISV